MRSRIKVWDIATRLFHWSLVACFFVAYVTGEEEDLLHVYSSYFILGLLAFRLVWGIVGPRYVRFTNFLYGIRPTLAYLQSILLARPKYYLGHNPLGGWMILFLLLALGMTSWTGLELYAKEGRGPLAMLQTALLSPAHANGNEQKEHDDEYFDRENEQGKKWLGELHEALANFTLLLVFVHIGGVLLSGWIHKENLIKAMWTGYKTPPADASED